MNAQRIGQRSASNSSDQRGAALSSGERQQSGLPFLGGEAAVAVGLELLGEGGAGG